MKPTSIPRISLTKSIFTRFSSIIHPPLPLTPIESRKFLSLIKDSFRTQLNAATPAIAPTEEHFSSIITAAQSSSVPVIDDGYSKEERIKRFLSDPLGVFIEQALLGKVTMELATVCLMKHAKLQRAAGTAAPKVPEQDSATAVVLGELRKAGFGSSATVLKNEEFLKAVMYTLVVEGRIDMILRWAKSTREEAILPVKASIVKQAVYYMKTEYGWLHAADLFRRVLGGSRENQGRFSQREHCSTGMSLCETGLSEGFGGTPEFVKLVRNSVHWAVHWQQQARVNLKYGKMTAVGIKYFQDLYQRDESFWEAKSSLWYHQNSRLAMKLALECLEQNQIKEAGMIAEITKKRFAGEVPGLEQDMGIDADKVAEQITQKRPDLQEILNALG